MTENQGFDPLKAISDAADSIASWVESLGQSIGGQDPTTAAGIAQTVATASGISALAALVAGGAYAAAPVVKGALTTFGTRAATLAPKGSWIGGRYVPPAVVAAAPGAASLSRSALMAAVSGLSFAVPYIVGQRLTWDTYDAIRNSDAGKAKDDWNYQISQLGRSSDEYLAELGFDAEEIAVIRAAYADYLNSLGGTDFDGAVPDVSDLPATGELDFEGVVQEGDIYSYLQTELALAQGEPVIGEPELFDETDVISYRQASKSQGYTPQFGGYSAPYSPSEDAGNSDGYNGNGNETMSVRKGRNGQWVWANSGKPVNAPRSSGFGYRSRSTYRRRY